LSHSKERHEKICLNCNSELHGRYCHQCGQENIEPKESVWGLISHFFYDITHFDGKFFGTTAKLITKPGFLPKEYMSGRRARYLHPIRMYVFSSAVFFLVFFSVFSVKMGPGIKDLDMQLTAADSQAIKMDSAEQAALKTAESKDDSAAITNSFGVARKVAAVSTGNYRYLSKDSAGTLPADSTGQSTKAVAGTSKKDSGKTDVTVGGLKVKSTTKWGTIVNGKQINTVREYDSAQAKLPKGERDNWLERRVNTRNLELKERYKDDGEALLKDLMNKFLHTFPYLLFLSLPLYALFLKFLYIRRKQFYYTDHGIFLIYLYIFTFILLLLVFSFDELQKSLNWDWIVAIEAILLLYGVWYAYKAMRKFYMQGTGKTLLKFMILNFLAFISIIFLFSLFFIITVFQI
jgi:hypothetical protein